MDIFGLYGTSPRRLAKRAILPERFRGPSSLAAYVDLVYEDRVLKGK